MSCIDRYCPEAVVGCIRMFLRHFTNKDGKKRKNEANGIEQLEQEEFQFTPSTRINHNQHHQTHLSNSKESQNMHEQQEQNLSYKLNLHSHSQGQHQQTSKLYKQQEQTSNKLTNFNFKLNLQPYDQYYPVIDLKTKKIEELFNVSTKNILTRNTKSCISIEQIQTVSGFKMIITYKLPSSYAYFKTVNRNYQIVSQLNNIISNNKIVQTIHPNLTINSLSFKKFLLLQPRFFNYLKYQNSTQNYHWEICTSIKGRPQTEPSEKQCELTSISCFQQRKGELIANTYLQVDLKTNLRASKVILRFYQELASYIDNLFDYLSQNNGEGEV